jgi:Annexin
MAHTSGLLIQCLLCMCDTVLIEIFDLINILQTDEDAVVRILGSHDKNELLLIAEHYLETYGETVTELLKSGKQ